MLCGQNGALNEISEAIGKASDAIDGAMAAYTQAIALISQIESIATNLVPTILAKLQAEGGLVADMLELATIQDPFAFAAKVIEIEKKYGKGTVSDLGWDSFPPSFNLTDICAKVQNLQEDGSVIPNEPTAPKAAPTKEERPDLEEVNKLNELLDAVIEEINFVKSEAAAATEKLKSAATEAI